MKTNFSPRHCCVAAFLCFTAAVRAAAPNVTVTIHAFESTNAIRNDITRATFGSGVEHQTPQFRTLMATPTAAQNAIKNMNLGAFRFPNGTPGLFYYWNMPKESYISVAGPTKNDILTPDEIYSFTSPGSLNMDRLFEVNTFQYKSPDFQVHPVIQPGSSPAQIHTQNLQGAAQSAAGWVAENLGRSSSQRVNYWEIGNEDWVYWTPAEYATIFNEFASRMKAARPDVADIKLLAQSLTTPFTPAGKPTNNEQWLQGMINGGINRQQVYALSEHEYLDGGIFSTGSYNDQRIWQTQNLFAQVANSWNVPFLKGVLQNNQLDWKIWMTEFNLQQKGADGALLELQDLGHALIVADWTGKMLEQGVDRIFMHSLDHNPYFALVNYVNSGGTISAPRVTVPGYAYAKYAQAFGQKMVTNTLLGNATLYSPNNGGYPQVAVYSSVMESDPVYAGYPSMRIMVINRSTMDSANMTIKTQNRPIAGSAKNYSVQTLTAATISDSNKMVADHVRWSNPVLAPSNSTAITRTLPKASATFFIIPLQ